MKFKCPKCGSLNTTVTDYDTLGKNLESKQMNASRIELPPDAWAKIIAAVIAAATDVIKAIIDWMAKKNTQPKKEKKFFIVCKDCHTLTKLDEKTYEEARQS